MTDKKGAAPADPTQKPPARKKNGHFAPDVRGKMRTAIDIMLQEGVTDHLAAERAGVRIDNLRRTLKRPNVIKLFNQRLKEMRENAAIQAYTRNIHLSQTSQSDTVKADLNKWLAGVDGISPVKKVEGRHTVSHSFGGFSYDADDLQDVTPTDHTSGGHDD